MNSEKGENSRREQAKIFNFQSAEKPYITPFERNFMFLNITGFRVKSIQPLGYIAVKIGLLIYLKHEIKKY